MMLKIRSCLECPFLWPPHCNVRRKLKQIPDRIMEKRGAAPRYLPTVCPLLTQAITVEIG